MPLLERESALASLTEYAEQARAGEGRLVLVGGEAGVGKSTLVETFAGRLADARWAWGMCDGLFTPRPLGPLFDLAAELGWAPGDLSRDQLFDALLRAVGGTGSLDVLVIEDLHWADEATIDLVRFLARRLRNTAVLLIVTYRDDSLTKDTALRIALGDIGTQRSTRRIGLAPLSARAVEILAADSGLEPAELHRLTGGNPYFVGELVQTGSAAVSRVPVSARDAVLARCALLSADARAVLDVGALLGTRIDPALLTTVTGCAPAALDELIQEGLLVGDGAGLRFRHELARLAVEQAVPVHRVGPIHARILAALRAQGSAALRAQGSADDARMAFHAEAAGDRAATLEHAVRAGRRAAELKSHREAAAQYQRAVACDPDDPELQDAFAFELSLVDRWDEVAAATDRARVLWEAAGNPRRAGAALRLRSAAMVSLCRGDEAIADAEAALAMLRPHGEGPELAWAFAYLAVQRMLADRYAEAIELARHAQGLAERLGLHDVLSDALDTEGCSRVSLGDESGLDLLRRALDIAVGHRLDEQAGRAYTNIHSIYCELRRYDEAAVIYAEGIAYCDEHDVSTFGSCLRGCRANALSAMGHSDEAAALCRQVLSSVYATSPINRINLLCCAAAIRARRGEPGVWEYLDEAMVSADGCAEPQWIIKARAVRAHALWLEGRIAEARTEAELADDVVAASDEWSRGLIAVWLRRTGSARPPRGDVPEPYRLELAGDWAGAAQAWLGLSSPYEAATALLGAADEALLRRAVGMLGDLGATAAIRVARQRLRERGARSVPVGPRTATRGNPHGLTRREQEVFELLGDGRTNAEIAGRLVLSVKTVEHHVSAVLTKLGVSTRADAARRGPQI